MRSIERTAPLKGLPIIGPKRGILLDEVVLEYSPKAILEVGTLVGYSAIRMARHLTKGGKITCIEIREDMAKTARQNVKDAGLSDRVEVLVGDANDVIPTLKGNFDMLFLDAVKDQYIDYLKSSERLLHKGSVVVADNAKLFAKELTPYLDYVRNSGKYSSTYKESDPNYGTDESDAIEVSVML